MAKQFGRTEPRLWTKPLRELTPETSLGFQVIAFAAEVLGVTLYPVSYTHLTLPTNREV